VTVTTATFDFYSTAVRLHFKVTKVTVT